LIAEFKAFFRYVRKLKFEQKPDYEMLSESFKDLFYKKKYEEAAIFDWTLKFVYLFS
jgi:hypothetical protein